VSSIKIGPDGKKVEEKYFDNQEMKKTSKGEFVIIFY
jgi:hypothetical protein